MRIRDENKEAAIREKAMQMIVDEGFHGFSMQKLAKTAGVSPATIYIYFKNKEDLLNSLYNDVHQTFARVALENFDPAFSLEKGLWLQWKNRMKFIFQYPVHYKFYEQFRNSPLIHHRDIRKGEFRENMKAFVINAIKNEELAKMDPEAFWALAYGSFYTLIHFHLQGKSMMHDPYAINDDKMKRLLQQVLKALRP
ncbi:MAG TPA: TetR/AcrR family transcriptional regulator [Saprospiraceae bacterium]|nr:TetR/AcrR family transcriptional regulator [Saprospiraceae bacterium]